MFSIFVFDFLKISNVEETNVAALEFKFEMENSNYKKLFYNKHER